MDIQEIFHYRGFWGCAAHCRLRIVRRDACVVVIATEVPDNEGTSITNMAEQLATIVTRQFGFDPTQLVWIEHYPADPDLELDETYDLARFAWDGERFSAPRWKRLDRATVERLIGKPMEDADRIDVQRQPGGSGR